jgi:hypothetical protein
MIGLIMIVAILCVLAVVAVKSLDGTSKAATAADGLGSTAAASGSSGTGGEVLAGPGGLVAQAADLVAKNNLALVLSVADEVAATSGYGGVSPASLAAVGRGLQYTSSASSSASEISVAAVGGTDGAVTLAVHSASGVCWLIWASSGLTWYGAESDHTSCVAPRLSSAPSARTTGTGVVHWQPGTFPTA